MNYMIILNGNKICDKNCEWCLQKEMPADEINFDKILQSIPILDTIDTLYIMSLRTDVTSVENINALLFVLSEKHKVCYVSKKEDKYTEYLTKRFENFKWKQCQDVILQSKNVIDFSKFFQEDYEIIYGGVDE